MTCGGGSSSRADDDPPRAASALGRLRRHGLLAGLDRRVGADPGRGSVALEIELSRKGGPRVRAVLNGYELHHRIERVVYLAAPAALPALTKAIAAGVGGGKVVALPLTGECPPLGGPALPAVRGRASGPTT